MPTYACCIRTEAHLRIHVLVHTKKHTSTSTRAHVHCSHTRRTHERNYHDTRTQLFKTHERNYLRHTNAIIQDTRTRQVVLPANKGYDHRVKSSRVIWCCSQNHLIARQVIMKWILPIWDKKLAPLTKHSSPFCVLREKVKSYNQARWSAYKQQWSTHKQWHIHKCTHRAHTHAHTHANKHALYTYVYNAKSQKWYVARLASPMLTLQPFHINQSTLALQINFCTTHTYACTYACIHAHIHTQNHNNKCIVASVTAPSCLLCKHFV